jgi:hypothetical protein
LTQNARYGMILNMMKTDKHKTDWHFIILLVAIAVLGVHLTFISKHIDSISIRVDRLELDTIENESPPLPHRRAEQPTIFEGLGINKEGEVEE